MSMRSVREYTAAMTVTEGYIDVPAHDVVHPPTAVYSEGFESGLRGWSFPNFGGIGGSPAAHTGVSGIYAQVASSGAGSAAQATVLGLTVGRSYTLSAWMKLWDSPGSGAVAVGIVGIGHGSTATPTTTWQQLSYTFTATTTGHTLQLWGPANAYAYWDDVVLTQNQWSEHIADHTAYSLPLTILDGSSSLDENRAPYGQAQLTVALPEKDEWVALIDNRTVTRRLTITAKESWTAWGVPFPPSYAVTSTFDLTLRERVLDLNQKTVALTLETDESLLDDYQRVATTTDTTARQYQTSVRSIINNSVLSKIGATLEAGTADADFTTLTSVTNMMTNPAASVDLTNATSSGLTSLARQTGRTGTSHGTAFRLNGSASNGDSYLAVGGDETAMRLGMQAGKTYTALGLFQQDSAMGGTDGTRTRSIQVVVKRGAGAAAIFAFSPKANNVAGSQRLSVTFTLPSDTTAAAIRWYHGNAATSTVYWTDLLLVEGDGKETDTANNLAYFDGDTTTSAFYTYAWSGTAGSSASSRTPRYTRDPETLNWQPGVSAYDFIRPVLDTVGLRLFCDENRKWRLVDPSYSIPTRVQLSGANPLDNVYTAKDTISKTATGPDGLPLTYSGVVVKYAWVNAQGNPQTAVDTAGSSSPGPVLVWEVDRPYMGPGMASYILARGIGKGRTLDITARRDFTVRPGMEVVTTLPLTPIQTGRVGSVSWDFSSDDMTVGTKGLTDTPPNAWALAPNGRTWATATGTWTTYTN